MGTPRACATSLSATPDSTIAGCESGLSVTGVDTPRISPP